MTPHKPIVDLTTDVPRSPRERLDGMDILARAIDKARAELAGRLGDYIYWNCPINRVLFTTLQLSDEQFLAAVRTAADADQQRRIEFVEDVEESLEAPSFLNDQQVLDRETAAAIDDAMIAWIRDVVKPVRASVEAMNERFERMTPTPEQRVYFAAELASTGTMRTDITTYADLLDLQEGRLIAP